MKYGKMITRWSGYLPVVEDIPSKHAIWARIENFMDKITNISSSTQGKSLETYD